MRLLALLVVGFAASAPAHAQKRDPCASPSTTIEINECAQKALKRKDAELNKAYRALLGSLAPTMPGDGIDYEAVKKELAEAQRAWVRFRDADCGAKYRYWEQGSIRGAMYLSCLIDRTDKRTAELRKWADM